LVHPVPCAYLRDVLNRLPAMTNRQVAEITTAGHARRLKHLHGQAHDHNLALVAIQ
jgi:hypothetical protein